jgi:enolase
MVNILNGGKHAGGDLQIQEFMIVPKGDVPFTETLRMMAEVYHNLSKILVKEKGTSAKNLGDEGGFAPLLKSPAETLDYIERAIEAAGYKVGVDCFLALDCAASEYFNDDKNAYEVEKGLFLPADQLIEYYLKLKAAHPSLISIEDGFDEHDYDAWTKFTAVVAQKHPEMMLVGDDLYTTNTDLIKKGVAAKWANALLLKVNQIGTITESMDAARMIFESGGRVAVSHRSGENCGALISDLAVAIGAQFLKTGAPARGERVSKYNRLLAIEEYLKENKMLAPYAH